MRHFFLDCTTKFQPHAYGQMMYCMSVTYFCMCDIALIDSYKYLIFITELVNCKPKSGTESDNWIKLQLVIIQSRSVFQLLALGSGTKLTKCLCQSLMDISSTPFNKRTQSLTTTVKNNIATHSENTVILHSPNTKWQKGGILESLLTLQHFGILIPSRSSLWWTEDISRG